jgi:cytochrome c5
MVSRIAWLAGLLMCVPGLVQAQGRGGGGPQLPEGEGKALVQSVCATACHDATPLLMKRDGANGWRRNAERMMVQKGGQISPEELEAVVRYLSTSLGPGTGTMLTGTLPTDALVGGAANAKDVKLPDGAGRDVVAVRCAMCHDLGRVVSIQRTKQDWDRITRNMLGRVAQAGNPAQTDQIVAYLSTHFLKEGQ